MAWRRRSASHITRMENIRTFGEKSGKFVDTHAVTVVINRLRKKIENNMTEPVYIRNVFGVGYTFGE